MEESLFHPPAIDKIRRSPLGFLVKAYEALATTVYETGARDGTSTFKFITDDEPVDAPFVPEFSITVRKLGE